METTLNSALKPRETMITLKQVKLSNSLLTVFHIIVITSKYNGLWGVKHSQFYIIITINS